MAKRNKFGFRIILVVITHNQSLLNHETLENHFIEELVYKNKHGFICENGLQMNL